MNFPIQSAFYKNKELHMSHVCSKKFKTKKMLATRRTLPCQYIGIFLSLNFSIPRTEIPEENGIFRSCSMSRSFLHSDIITQEHREAVRVRVCIATVGILCRIREYWDVKR